MTDFPRNGTPHVIIDPSHNEALNAPSFSGVWSIATYASQGDSVPAWGTAWKARDQYLRAFWITEPMLASAIFSTAARYAGFGYQLTGPERTVKICQGILQSVENGEGWASFMMKLVIDLFTADNGAHFLLLRTEDDPASPVVSLRHLDSLQCSRTGRPEEPILYTDRAGDRHLLKWYQVVSMSEMPSPVETAYGAQTCVVSRVLRAAQIIRDISIYHREKVSGRDPRSIYVVGGITKRQIDDHMKLANAEADNQRLSRYIGPVIIGSPEPTAHVNVAEIALASLPDGFDFDLFMKWYISQLALGFGGDYQDYAPLPGGNLGTSQQSSVLHMKSRAKGSKLFMSMFEHIMNFRGILPQTVHFSFGDQDVAEDAAKAEVRLLRAKERQIRIQSGELSHQAARELAHEQGDLPTELMNALGESDPVPHITVSNNERPPSLEEAAVKKDPKQTFAPLSGAGGVTMSTNSLGARTGGTGVPNSPAGVSADDPTKRVTLAKPSSSASRPR